MPRRPAHGRGMGVGAASRRIARPANFYFAERLFEID
jgi:hypothetical protein